VRSYWKIDDFKWANTEFGADHGRIYFTLQGKNWKPGLHHHVFYPADAASSEADYRQWSPDFEFADTKFDVWLFMIALRKQHPGFWTFSYISVVVRLWPVAIAAAAPMLLKLAFIIRTHRHNTFAQCSHCGYDLRATPDRCPECGHHPEKVKSTS
jgi:hypothetical protein